MERKDKIQKFIVDNKLDFTGTGSSLNGNCVILAGYADYLEYEDYRGVLEDTGMDTISSELENEFMRVFDYAYMNNYRNFWHTPKAKLQYTFEEL